MLTISLTLLAGLVVLIAINTPIAVAICAVALGGLYFSKGDLGLFDAALKMYDGATSFPLIAIPLFVLAGALMNTTGISRRLIDFVSALIGFVRGGLAMVNVGVSLFFAEISGSAVADVAAVGSVLIPGMKQRRYKATFAAAVTSASASLAVEPRDTSRMCEWRAEKSRSISRLRSSYFNMSDPPYPPVCNPPLIRKSRSSPISSSTNFAVGLY